MKKKKYGLKLRIDPPNPLVNEEQEEAKITEAFKKNGVTKYLKKRRYGLFAEKDDGKLRVVIFDRNGNIITERTK
jgi:hypothetical protein